MIVPDSCVQYISLQRTNYIDVKKDYVIDMKNEFKTILNFLPVDCESIIDIGCGIGGIDVLLYQYYNSPLLFLIDKNEKPEKIIYGFSDKTSYYNSFDALKEMMEQNKIPTFAIIDEDRKQAVPKQIDIIISLLACGFHFHVNKYLNFIIDRIKKNGALIIDIRKTQHKQISFIEKYFKYISEIETTNPKTIRICAKGLK